MVDAAGNDATGVVNNVGRGVEVGFAVGLACAGVAVADPVSDGVIVGLIGVDVGMADPVGVVLAGLVGVGVEVADPVGVGVTVGLVGVGVGPVAVGTGVIVCPAGIVTTLPSSVTAVCASALPFSVAPVFSTIAVCPRMFPLKTAVVPSVVWPATCQNMFFACAPPARTTCLAELMSRVPAI